MVTRRISGDGTPMEPGRKSRPATTPEAREQQLIAMSYDLAERQILDGTASSQTIAHFLKMGSSRERAEQARLARENLLLEAKVEQMATAARIEVLIGDAMNAMRAYQGLAPLQLEEEAEDDY